MEPIPSFIEFCRGLDKDESKEEISTLGNEVYVKRRSLPESKEEEVNSIINAEEKEDNYSLRSSSFDSYSEASSSNSKSRRLSPLKLNKESRNILHSKSKTGRKNDEWRRVENGGKVYFYNRRTRESVWHLPPGALASNEKNDSGMDLNPGLPYLVGGRGTEKLASSSKAVDHYSNEVAARIASKLKKRNSIENLMSEVKKLNLSIETMKLNRGQDKLSPRENREENSSHIDDGTDTSSWHASATKLERQSTKNSMLGESLLGESSNIYCTYCGLQSSLQSIQDHLGICERFHAMKTFRKDIKAAYISSWDIEGTLNNGSQNEYVEESSTKKIEELSVSKGTDVKRKLSTSANSSSLLSNTLLNISKGKVMNKCPFCGIQFTGEKLSGHLLKCKERRRTRTRRMTPKKKASKAEKLMVQGGRCLPGHPSVKS